MFHEFQPIGGAAAIAPDADASALPASIPELEPRPEVELDFDDEPVDDDEPDADLADPELDVEPEEIKPPLDVKPELDAVSWFPPRPTPESGELTPDGLEHAQTAAAPTMPTVAQR